MAATFSVGGLASGLDTNSLIDKLVQLESQPLTDIQNRQAGIQSQLSTIGQIVSKLQALSTASADLKNNGALVTKVASSNDSFTATPGSSATAGRYSVQVESLAQASKWRSVGFASGETLVGGTLQLEVQGTTYDPISIADGTSLEDAAFAIRQSGAPVSAVVLNDGTHRYLSITALDTGYSPTGAPSDALTVTFTPGAGSGKDPGFAEKQAAVNAVVNVDGISFTRQSNTVTDAIPGTTLTLESMGAAEDLVIGSDADGTQARLQKFVSAYNDVQKVIQAQLSPGPGTDRSSTLAGDGTIRNLQAKLASLITTSVGAGGIRTLADLGVKTERDGTLSVDSTILSNAVARNGSAVNALFATASTGLGDLVDGLVTSETRIGDGLLTIRQDGLNASIKQLGAQAAAVQLRIDSFRQRLVDQFTAMESTVSNLKSIGSFLTAQDAKSS